MNAQLISATKRFGSFVAVDDVSYSVDGGEVVGLLGANGAGKTTSMRMLLGLTTPSEGRAELFGAPPGRDTVRRVGYVPQGLGLYDDLTPAENLAFQAGVYGVAAAPAEDLQRWWNTRVAELPLGVRRRVAFHIAFAHHPELLVLDEPTSGVGPLGRARLWDTIRDAAESGIGVLVSTHHLEEAEQCDRLIMLAAGKVAATGDLADIIGGRTAVTVTTDAWTEAFSALRGAGLPVSLVGSRLRVPGTDPATVEDVLRRNGIEGDLTSHPATLEETFVDLSR